MHAIQSQGVWECDDPSGDLRFTANTPKRIAFSQSPLLHLLVDPTIVK